MTDIMTALADPDQPRATFDALQRSVVETIGTLNCLDVAGHYTPRQIQANDALKPQGAIAFLMHDLRSPVAVV